MGKDMAWQYLVRDPAVYLHQGESAHVVLAGGFGDRVPSMAPRNTGSPRRGPGLVNRSGSRMVVSEPLTEQRWEDLLFDLGLPEPWAVAVDGGEIEVGRQQGTLNPEGLTWRLVTEWNGSAKVDEFLHPFFGPRCPLGIRLRDREQSMRTGAALFVEWAERRPRPTLSFMEWCAA